MIYMSEQKKKAGALPSGDMLKSVGMVAMMGDILAGDTLKEKNDWKLRMFKAGMGEALSLPDDWDSLSEEIKAERLDKIIEIATGKDE